MSGTECVLCRQSTDDEVQFGQKYTCEGVTAHYYCLVSLLCTFNRQNLLVQYFECQFLAAESAIFDFKKCFCVDVEIFTQLVVATFGLSEERIQ